MEGLSRITLDPAVMAARHASWAAGQGGTVVRLLAAGRSPEEILSTYPYLEREDIDQALTYAAWRVQEREVSLPRE